MAKKAEPKKKMAPKKKAPPKKKSAPVPPAASGEGACVLDRLHAVVASRRGADPTTSHSARLLSRGTAKVAQKFGEEAVECLIEAVSGNRTALIAESADVLYHLLVMWVDAGVAPDEVWAELRRREGISGIAEKASRSAALRMRFAARTRKIP
ncbi:MAG TPA: phosphoribosyl-ATP diphosphatase [Acetobacteraceae bacterium]|nr:phosphoribosyl-ATP diphosphatase [Acetobacteraceae bacterium]